MQELIDATPSRNRDLVTAMLVAQVSRRARSWRPRGRCAPTATSSLGQVLGVTGCDEDTCMPSWIGCWPASAIEDALAARHLVNGTLVLYDVSSARSRPHLPAGGDRARQDGVKGRLQIVYGLLCSPAGIPVAIEVFEGNTADPNTLAAQIAKIKNRFGLSRVCLVGDRGMLTNARINDECRPAQLYHMAVPGKPAAAQFSIRVS